MTQKELLDKTTILFDDFEEYKPKICIVKKQEPNGMYHLKESRDLTEQEIYRIFFGLAKYLETQNKESVSNSKETLTFQINQKDE